MSQKQAKRNRRNASTSTSSGRKSTTQNSNPLRNIFSRSGISPTPALNFSRPYSYDQNLTLATQNGQAGLNPYEFGNLQYSVISVGMDDLSNTTALALASQKVYEAIRNQLRSNLMYDSSFLQAYFLRTLYIIPTVAIMSRDLGFRTFASPELPNFDKVLGVLVGSDVYDDLLPGDTLVLGTKPSINVTNLDKKSFMNADTIVSTVDWYEKVLKQLLQLLPLPATLVQYFTYLFGNIFIESRRDGGNQLYWFDAVTMPIYNTEYNSETRSYNTTFSSYVNCGNIGLSALEEDIRDIINTFGVVIADLNKVSQMSVLPTRDLYANGVPQFVHDSTILGAIDNAYTGFPNDWYAGEGQDFDTDFVLIDVPGSTNTEEVASLLQFSGALIGGNGAGEDPANRVQPLYVIGQSGIVYSAEHVMVQPTPYFVGEQTVRYEIPMQGLIGLHFTSAQPSPTSYLQESSGAQVTSWPTRESNETLYIVGSYYPGANGLNRKEFRNTSPTGNVLCIQLGNKVGNRQAVLITWYANNGWSERSVFKDTEYGSSSETRAIFALVSDSTVSFTNGLAIVPANSLYLGNNLYEAWSGIQSGSVQVEFPVGAVLLDMTYVRDDSGNAGVGSQIVCEQVSFRKPAIMYNGAGPTYTPESFTLYGTLMINTNNTGEQGVYIDSTEHLLMWMLSELTHKIPVYSFKVTQIVPGSGEDYISVGNPILIKDTKFCSVYSTDDLRSILFIMYTSLFYPQLSRGDFDAIRDKSSNGATHKR